MDTAALLVKKTELEKYVGEIIKTERELVTDLETIIPYVKNEPLLKSLNKRLRQGRECLVALEAGYIPFAGGYFTRVDTKNKWKKKWVKETLDSMPPEVKEVWEKVEAQGIFESFSVTTGGGDPILVGNRGGKHFVIAGWLPVTPGVNMGFRIKMP